MGIAFDSETVASLPRGWWTPLLWASGSVMHASAALLGALGLVAWARKVNAAARPPRPGRPARQPPHDPPLRFVPWLIVHLTSFIVLFAVSAALFGEGAPARAQPGRLVAGWLFVVAVTVGTWLCAMLPPRFLLAIARARAGLLAGAVGFGLLAFFVGRLTQGLWLPLRKLTFGASSALTGLLAPGAFADPDTLTFGTRAFSVEIAPQCSGYEGVGLTWAFLLGALWLFRARFRFPRAFLLLALGAVLPLVANIGRLVALVLVGTYLSPAIAAGGFHSYAGSLMFCAVALGIVALGLHASWFARAPRAAAGSSPVVASLLPSPSSSPPPVELDAEAHPSPAPYLVPFLAMTAATLLSRAFSTAEAEPMQLLRPLAALIALAAFRRDYREMSWRPSWFAAPLGLGVAALWLALAYALRSSGALAATPPPAAGLLLVARLGTVVLLVPVVEELAFRGFLVRRVVRADFDRVLAARAPWWALAVSAVVFGLLHQRPLLGIAAGAAYGFAYRLRGRLADAVLAHAVTNAALVPVAWLTGAWDLWK